jgi:hypothetical protein
VTSCSSACIERSPSSRHELVAPAFGEGEVAPIERLEQLQHPLPIATEIALDVRGLAQTLFGERGGFFIARRSEYFRNPVPNHTEQDGPSPPDVSLEPRQLA